MSENMQPMAENTQPVPFVMTTAGQPDLLLFIKTDGQPFSPEQLRDHINAGLGQIERAEDFQEVLASAQRARGDHPWKSMQGQGEIENPFHGFPAIKPVPFSTAEIIDPSAHTEGVDLPTEPSADEELSFLAHTHGSMPHLRSDPTTAAHQQPVFQRLESEPTILSAEDTTQIKVAINLIGEYLLDVFKVSEYINLQGAAYFLFKVFSIPNALVYPPEIPISVTVPAPHGIIGGGPGSWPVSALKPSTVPWIKEKATSSNRIAPAVSVSDHEKAEGDAQIAPVITISGEERIREEAENNLMPSDPGDILVVVLDAEPKEHWKQCLSEEVLAKLPCFTEKLECIHNRFMDSYRPQLDFKVVSKHLHASKELDPGADTAAAIDMWKTHTTLMHTHGIFVASIIHQLAPEADIVLIPVFTQQGLGTIESLCETLLNITTLIEEQTTKQLSDYKHIVINLSGYAFPGDTEAIQTLSGLLTFLFDIFYQLALDTLIKSRLEALNATAELTWIAAAGNTIKAIEENSSRPEAAWPATLKKVIGIGAINSDRSTAPYTHKPDKEGFYTVGGDVDHSNTRLADENLGMLGVFTGNEFFIPHPDKKVFTVQSDTNADITGWARWAGTSFAAALYSGIVAARLLDRPLSEHAVGDLPTDQDPT